MSEPNTATTRSLKDFEKRGILMKKSSKCMVAVLLAVLTVLSSISIVGSFAAENDMLAQLEDQTADVRMDDCKSIEEPPLNA